MSYRIVKASAHQTGLPDKSVHMIATSSPYYGLRAYAGDQEVDWPEVVYAPMSGVPALVIPAQRCGLGAEETVEAFIGHLILVAREMWRVLRDDGTLWWNLGDSYNGSGGAGGDYGPGGSKEGQPKFPGRKVKGGKTLYKMKQDLTPEQKAYVLSELAKANSICDLTQDGRE